MWQKYNQLQASRDEELWRIGFNMLLHIHSEITSTIECYERFVENLSFIELYCLSSSLGEINEIAYYGEIVFSTIWSHSDNEKAYLLKHVFSNLKLFSGWAAYLAIPATRGDIEPFRKYMDRRLEDLRAVENILSQIIDTRAEKLDDLPYELLVQLKSHTRTLIASFP